MRISRRNRGLFEFSGVLMAATPTIVGDSDIDAQIERIHDLLGKEIGPPAELVWNRILKSENLDPNHIGEREMEIIIRRISKTIKNLMGEQEAARFERRLNSSAIDERPPDN